MASFKYAVEFEITTFAPGKRSVEGELKIFPTVVTSKDAPR